MAAFLPRLVDYVANEPEYQGFARANGEEGAGTRAAEVMTRSKEDTVQYSLSAQFMAGRSGRLIQWGELAWSSGLAAYQAHSPQYLC